MARRTPKPCAPARPAGWLNARDAVWLAIRMQGADGRSFTVRGLVDAAKVSRNVVDDFLAQLAGAGFVRKVDEPVSGGSVGFVSNAWVLLRDTGVDTPRFDGKGRLRTEPTVREKLWQAMKALGSFTAVELSMTAGARVSDVRSYLTSLIRAEYVVTVAKHRGGSPARYRLLAHANTGPRPPAVRRDKSVFDPNLGRQVWPVEAGPGEVRHG